MQRAERTRPMDELDPTAVPVARAIYGGSAVIYGLLALLYLIAPPVEPHLPIAAIFTLGAAVFVTLAMLIPRVPPRWLEPLVLASALIAEAGAIAFLPLTGDPTQSVVVVVVIVAAGAVVPTLRSALIAALAGLGGWLVVARGFPEPELAHWLLNVAGAALVSVAVAAARLRAQRKLLLTRFMIDRANDAIALIDRDARLVYVNDAICTMLGFTRAELLRMTLPDIAPSTPRETWPEIWDAMRRERTLVVQSSYVTRDGRDVPVEASLNLATLGGSEYVCTVNRDVTERRRVEQQLERARHAAEAASRAKSEFLANMSHEMRTPLNGVFGMLDLALEERDAGERRELLLGARTCAESLLGVLTQVLDHADLAAGRTRLDAVEFDLRDLGRLVAGDLAGEARRRGLDLRLYCDPELPELVRGDAGHLRQVLGQLVANALKFTDAGEVELRLECAPCDGGDVQLVGSVRDTGIGIAGEQIPAIFEPFTQVDPSHSRRHGGVGLGLALVRDLMHAMGGTVDVSSTPGIGSTFTCRLPLARATSPRQSSGAQL